MRLTEWRQRGQGEGEKERGKGEGEKRKTEVTTHSSTRRSALAGRAEGARGAAAMRRRGALPVPTFAPLPQRVAQSLPTAAAQTDRAAARSVTDWRERRQTAPLVRVGVVARLVVPLSPSYDPCLSMWFEPRLARAGGAPPPRSRRCATQLHSHPPMLPRPPRAGTPPTPASPPPLSGSTTTSQPRERMPPRLRPPPPPWPQKP